MAGLGWSNLARMNIHMRNPEMNNESYPTSPCLYSTCSTLLLIKHPSICMSAKSEIILICMIVRGSPGAACTPTRRSALPGALLPAALLGTRNEPAAGPTPRGVTGPARRGALPGPGAMGDGTRRSGDRGQQGTLRDP